MDTNKSHAALMDRLILRPQTSHTGGLHKGFIAPGAHVHSVATYNGLIQFKALGFSPQC